MASTVPRGLPTKEPPKPRVLIIQNDVLCPPASAIASLVEKHIPYQLVFGTYSHTFEHIHPLMYEAIILLGGRAGVYERDEKKWLAAEIDFIRVAIYNKVPVLGICLGSQVLAHAVGGEVMPGNNGIEIGYDDWQYIKKDSNNVGYTNDPFLYVLKQKCLNKYVVLFHGDTFTLPDKTKITNSAGETEYLDVELLARSCKKQYNTLFRVGEHSYGFQGHPELNFDLVNIWCRAWDPSFLKKATQRHLNSVIAYAEENQHKKVISSKILFDVWIDFALVNDQYNNLKTQLSQTFKPSILNNLNNNDSDEKKKQKTGTDTKKIDELLIDKYNDLDIWEQQDDASENKIDNDKKDLFDEILNGSSQGKLDKTMSYKKANLCYKSVDDLNASNKSKSNTKDKKSNSNNQSKNNLNIHLNLFKLNTKDHSALDFEDSESDSEDHQLQKNKN